jgi:hypothetical protein
MWDEIILPGIFNNAGETPHTSNKRIFGFVFCALHGSVQNRAGRFFLFSMFCKEFFFLQVLLSHISNPAHLSKERD